MRCTDHAVCRFGRADRRIKMPTKSTHPLNFSINKLFYFFSHLKRETAHEAETLVVRITFLQFEAPQRQMQIFCIAQKATLARDIGGMLLSPLQINQARTFSTVTNASNTNLLQFPHGGNVVLELVQAPECGDSQLGVLNPHLQLSALLLVVRV